eukprot:TRINITY_DN6446_c0_g1_i1.p1 TRINITY_DN6446_c0_g1~~TRINITY_DN6446_c0_g1_i1.p1  ORF type:complete len:441 (-),score=69.51 TRINITY_DN6446_c0_g1_i1:20-1342(-)
MGTSASSRQVLTIEQQLFLISEYCQGRHLSLKEAFYFLDVDASGFVTWDEFLRGVQHCAPGTGYEAADPTALIDLFNRFDVNKDGRLSIEEFAAAFSGSPNFQGSYYDDFASRGLSSVPGAAAHVTAVRPLRLDELSHQMGEDVIARIASSVVRLGTTPQKLFSKLDLDKNGRLSRSELEQLIYGFEPHLSLSEKESLWRRFDKDASGNVDLNEFHKALADANGAALVAVGDRIRYIGNKFREQGLDFKRAFSIFDLNGDGFMSRDEWDRAMSLIGPELQSSDVESVFRRFDQNQDGYLNVAEFQDFFQNAMDLQPAVAVARPTGAHTPAPPARPTGAHTPAPPARPTPLPMPVEAAWETEVLDLVRSCLSYERSGMKITEVFRRLDIANSNTMTQYEFNRIVSTYRSDLSPDHLAALFYKVNVSKTGAITLGEFVRRFG